MLPPRLCITTRAGQCGRHNLDLAVEHAHERAVALGVRQAVLVQPGAVAGGGVYFRIVAAAGAL